MADHSNPKFPDKKPTKDQPKWRLDFPIEEVDENSLTRRDFAKFMVLTSGAFTVGQFSLVAQHTLISPPSPLPKIEINTIENTPVGSVQSFNYPDQNHACLLLRPDENTFLAFSQKCTHLACAVIPDLEKKKFLCPCHKGYFDLETGRPLAGPPRRPLTKVVLEIQEGIIFAVDLEHRI